MLHVIPFLLLLLPSIDDVEAVKPKHVHFGLKATWPQAPLIVECSEYFGSISSATYWSFIDAWAQTIASTPTSTHLSDAQQWSHLSTLLSSPTSSIALGTASLSVLQYSLAVHYYAPRVETFRQMLLEQRHELAIPISDDLLISCPALLATRSRVICPKSLSDADTLLDSHDIPTTHPIVDHILSPPDVTALPTIILYADLTTSGWATYHTWARQHVATGRMVYALRPKLVLNNATNLQLQGYGVELAIKNMEYKVLDDKRVELSADTSHDVELPDDGSQPEDVELSGFHFRRLMERHSAVASELEKFRQELLKEQAAGGDAKVSVWDMKDLGFQSSQRIISSPDPLLMLRELSQNFPMYASALTRVRLNRTVHQALLKHHGRDLYPAGTNVLHVNGKQIDPEEVDLFSLHSMLQSEAAGIDELHDLHLSSSIIRQLMTLKPTPTSSEETFPINMDVGGSVEQVITWLNDITKDSRYRSWPDSIQEYLQPAWPNQLRYVRKNCYTGVMILDPSTRAGLEMFAGARYFIQGNAPIRLGLVMWVPAEEKSGDETVGWNEKFFPSSVGWEEYAKSVKKGDTSSFSSSSSSIQSTIARTFHYLETEFNREAAFDFLSELANHQRDVVQSDVEKSFGSILKKKKSQKTKEKFQQLLVNEDMSIWIDSLRDYVHGRGFAQHEYPCMVVNNVIHRGAAGKTFKDVLMGAIYSEQQKLTMKVHQGEITDYTDIIKYWQSQPGVYSRLSERILQKPQDMKFASHLVRHDAENPQNSLIHFHHPDRESLSTGLTYHIIADFSSPAGLRLVAASIEHLLAEPNKKGQVYDKRVAFIHNPSVEHAHGPYTLGRLQQSLIASVKKTSSALQHLRKLVAIARALQHDETRLISALRHYLTLPSHPESVHKLVPQLVTSPSSSPIITRGVPTDYVSKESGLAAGENAILLNGRVIRIPNTATEMELSYDFLLLDQYEYSSHHVRDILQIIDSSSSENAYRDVSADHLTSDFVNTVISGVAFSLARRAATAASQPSIGVPHSTPLPTGYRIENRLAVIHWDNTEGTNALLKITAVLDPLSPAAQRLSGILVALRESFNMSITIFLNPKTGVTEFPLKRFYRFAISTQVVFDEQGALKPSPPISFRSLVTSHVLTAGVFVPESWLIESTFAAYDLDNLRLEDISESTTAIYQLEHLLLAGQCFDVTIREPPSGLQLVLGRPTTPYAGDTVVMQNLGYFQLKANPGVWQLRLAENRHSEIYVIEHGTSEKTVQVSTLPQYVLSFNDPLVRLNVRRRPGRELDELLQPTASKGVAHGLMNKLFGGAEKKETIHVFSIASGHLYERFLKIMMLSVVNSTSSPVKFWFIKNFLSPNFKQNVPLMAAKAGFEVEFVTYKWPQWLRRQSEKQRMIWGYKILFLDVLFPLNIPRVIYIDSDQVVRGDVKELWEMNLHGAPYAYTPFCDSNTATNGYRFWAQGYWKDHLRGKPYHISALYVVDLDTFRRMRAGDSLRSIYDNLSQDPNSLSNLDQDLPNYTQHMVPIFSLPQEWLWCETWCSMETLPQAKTIDLCNNPMTKTPKLEMAKKLLPEWTVYDERGAKLEAEALAEGKNAAATATSHSTSTSSSPSHSGHAHPHQDL